MDATLFKKKKQADKQAGNNRGRKINEYSET